MSAISVGLNTILVVDDDRAIARSLAELLKQHEFNALVASSGEEALMHLWSEPIDLVLSDVRMPGMSGYELCRKMREISGASYLPFVLMTGDDAPNERVLGLDAGADDFLSKPLNKEELLARIRSLIRVRHLHLLVEDQASELKRWTSELEDRVEIQVSQMERLSRLKRYFAPQIADMIVSDDRADLLKSHRQDVTVLFVDLRGFTSFSEAASPDDVMQVLTDYYAEVGELALEYQGTLGHIAGDGIMIFFNDPVEVPEHQSQAIRMALAMRGRLEFLLAKWQVQGFDLSFGCGIAEGSATLGVIGFREFWEYSVIGSVANMAARLCHEAKPGQILVSHRFLCSTALRADLKIKSLDRRTLKGVAEPVELFDLLSF